MSEPRQPVVLRRNRAVLRQQLIWRFVIALSVVAVLPATAGLGLPSWLRWAMVGVMALLTVRPSQDLDRTVTLDEEWMRRGFGRWAWSDLTSVRPGPPERPGPRQLLGSLTLHFGDRAVFFGRDWPLEALLVEAMARAPLDAQLARARDQRERGHGLDFGALWLGPRTLDVRTGGASMRRMDLGDVLAVALELSEDQAMFRVAEVGKEAVLVPVSQLRDPQLLAALLTPWSTTQAVPIFMQHPPPTEATPELGRWRGLVSAPLVGGIGLLTGVAFLGSGIHLARKGWDSLDWQPVPAEIVSARVWRPPTPPSNKRPPLEGEVTFRFVYEGTSYTGRRFDVSGTTADEAEDFKPGQQVTAWVSPVHPEDAVLDKGIPLFLFLLLMGMGLMLLVCSLWYTGSTVAGVFGWSWPPRLWRSGAGS